MPTEGGTVAGLRVSQRRPLACRGRPARHIEPERVANMVQNVPNERGNATKRFHAHDVGG